MSDVRELASLARLELQDDEVEALGAQLDTILGYIRRLQAVDVSGVSEDPTREPTTKQVRSALRDDLPGPSFDAARALAGVPELHERMVAVPRFKD